MYYWAPAEAHRTEVDFVLKLGREYVAIEVKSSARVTSKDFSGLRAIKDLAGMGGYVPAIDPEQQWTVEGENSPRHRVLNNLPGTPSFCRLVFRTKTLDDFEAMDLANRARAAVANVPR